MITGNVLFYGWATLQSLYNLDWISWLCYRHTMNNPTILVAEDDPAVRQGVVDALSFSGYQVMAAQDGKQAMNYALSTQYNLLLLDLVMPHHSGFEVLEALKRNRPCQPVIILSARGEEADRVTSKQTQSSRRRSER